MNPIYDELVVKYYLDKGVRPFSNQPIEEEKAQGYYDLSVPSNLVDNPSFEAVTAPTYNYFRL